MKITMFPNTTDKTLNTKAFRAQGKIGLQASGNRLNPSKERTEDDFRQNMRRIFLETTNISFMH